MIPAEREGKNVKKTGRRKTQVTFKLDNVNA